MPMMNRRTFLAVFGSAMLATTTAARADYTDDIVKWLSGQGYPDVEVTRTLLGRTRVFATASWGSREVILNPRTGEILRDTILDPNGKVVSVAGSTVAPSESGGHGDKDDHSGPGGGDDGGGGDDDEEDDDHGGDDGEDDDNEEEDDDHSGHG